MLGFLMFTTNFVCLFCNVVDAAALTASCSGGDCLVVDYWFVPSVDPKIKTTLFLFSSGFGFQFSQLLHDACHLQLALRFVHSPCMYCNYMLQEQWKIPGVVLQSTSGLLGLKIPGVVLQSTSELLGLW
jgi:hypothetical protein